jgi:hypothetical protein
MRRGAAALITAVALVTALSQPAEAARQKLVLRVDRVTAQIIDRKLVIDATGAVPTGGWKHAKLRIKPSPPESNVMVVEFVATPPPPKEIVIQALLPVSAKVVTGLPHYAITAVSVTAESNGITTQITRP